MQGVQVAPALNDENYTQHSGPARFKQDATAPPAKQGSVLKSTRKAFGNITNNAQARGTEVSAAKPQPLQQRRAFGDITNSAAKPPASERAATKKASSSLLSQPSSQPTTQAIPEPVSSKAELQEDLEPERFAGKTWEQLEKERWAELEAEAERSANAFLLSVAQARMFNLDYESEPEEEIDLGPPLPHPGQVFQVEPEVPLEELLLDSNVDLGSLLPDILVPDFIARHDDDNGTQASQLADAMADLVLSTSAAEADSSSSGSREGSGSGQCLVEADAADACSSPVAAPALQQPASLPSPEPMPW